VQRWNGIRERSRSAYEWMTGEDVARELARIDLPLSTYTQWYWKIDLHNFLHFLKLRVDAHAQWEIQEYGVKA
jgi:thymidylate synthase (FAD)